MRLDRIRPHHKSDIPQGRKGAHHRSANNRCAPFFFGEGCDSDQEPQSPPNPTMPPSCEPRFATPRADSCKEGEILALTRLGIMSSTY
jgi:hypothetical protein